MWEARSRRVGTQGWRRHGEEPPPVNTGTSRHVCTQAQRHAVALETRPRTSPCSAGPGEPLLRAEGSEDRGRAEQSWAGWGGGERPRPGLGLLGAYRVEEHGRAGTGGADGTVGLRGARRVHGAAAVQGGAWARLLRGGGAAAGGGSSARGGLTSPRAAAPSKAAARDPGRRHLSQGGSRAGPCAHARTPRRKRKWRPGVVTYGGGPRGRNGAGAGSSS